MAVLQVIGGGRMGEALLGGLLAAGWADEADIAVIEAIPERRVELEARFAGVAIVDAPVAADGTVIAVKPGDVAAACAFVVAAGTQRVLSIAAGVTLDVLDDACPEIPVVRAMPNTPALVGAGAAAISGGRNAGPADLEWAETILSSVGIVVRVPEHLLDAVTGLSGSGPAYIALVAEAMTEAGVLAGLPRETAATLVRQTLLGTARLLVEGDSGPEALRHAVTSPGGTTAAGLRELERHGLRAAFLDAVTAAADRSRQLGAR